MLFGPVPGFVLVRPLVVDPDPAAVGHRWILSLFLPLTLHPALCMGPVGGKSAIRNPKFTVGRAEIPNSSFLIANS
jgi:hypothetical protein